jgi:hypothetical protein
MLVAKLAEVQVAADYERGSFPRLGVKDGRKLLAPRILLMRGDLCNEHSALDSAFVPEPGYFAKASKEWMLETSLRPGEIRESRLNLRHCEAVRHLLEHNEDILLFLFRAQDIFV